MTRLWLNERIRVAVNSAGQPVRFDWHGQTHTVERIGNRWRVDVGWWRLHIWREHYKLTTDTGLLVIVYHDLVSGHWYLQRLYD